MRGLGEFQINQMKKGDARIPRLFILLRSTLDLLEDIAIHPHTAPAVAEPPPLPRQVPIQLDDKKLAYTIKEVRHLTSLSNSKLYADIKANRLRATKAGGRTLILANDLQAWIEGWRNNKSKR